MPKFPSQDEFEKWMDKDDKERAKKSAPKAARKSAPKAARKSAPKESSSKFPSQDEFEKWMDKDDKVQAKPAPAGREDPDMDHLSRENKLPAKVADVPAGGKGAYVEAGGDEDMNDKHPHKPKGSPAGGQFAQKAQKSRKWTSGSSKKRPISEGGTGKVGVNNYGAGRKYSIYD
jgi:hypothetical protein